MKAYPPTHLTLKESIERRESERLEEMNISDETLKEYAEGFIKHYRAVIERFFSNLAPYLARYVKYPYKITVVRWGPNGTFIGYRPNTEASVEVIKVQDFDPPLTSFNFFDIYERMQAEFVSFSFTFRTYDAVEAEVEGTRQALSDALRLLWLSIDGPSFNTLCLELLEAEGLTTDPSEDQNTESPDTKFDTVREALLQEPAGFRRTERWAFQFKHHRDDRVSAHVLRELEDYLKSEEDKIDTVCLVTSGDLTTIGRAIAVDNPRIRVWDRSVLNGLVNKHLTILGRYFATYSFAAETLSQHFDRITTSRRQEFANRLAACPSGREHFAQYESIGMEMWRYVFEGKLGEPKVQRQTSDGTQRRDVVFRNLRTSPFFERIFKRFDADFVIVDFKNHGAAIDSDEIEKVGLYSNDALGRFVVAVCRKGSTQTAESAQLRWLRNGIVVLVLKDENMLEMISRKERGEEPEDLLADALDELLIRF